MTCQRQTMYSRHPVLPERTTPVNLIPHLYPHIDACCPFLAEPGDAAHEHTTAGTGLCVFPEAPCLGTSLLVLDTLGGVSHLVGGVSELVGNVLLQSMLLIVTHGSGLEETISNGKMAKLVAGPHPNKRRQCSRQEERVTTKQRASLPRPLLSTAAIRAIQSTSAAEGTSRRRAANRSVLRLPAKGQK